MQNKKIAIEKDKQHDLVFPLKQIFRAFVTK